MTTVATPTLTESIAAALPLEITVKPGTYVKGDEAASKSAGYHVSLKAADPQGNRFQVSIGAWLIGSKKTGEKLAAVEVTDVTQNLTPLVLSMAPKTFSSGKTGLFANGKVIIGGQRFTVTAQAVKIA